MGWVFNATPRPRYPWERTGTHCGEGWVGTRAGLEGWGKFRLHRYSIPLLSRPKRAHPAPKKAHKFKRNIEMLQTTRVGAASTEQVQNFRGLIDYFLL